MMIPNIVLAIRHKEVFESKYHNPMVEAIEQMGRYGCFGFMIFNIPTTWFGWWSDEAFALYLIVDAVLVALYGVIWVLCWRRQSMFKALSLSVIPSIIFLFSGIMSRSVLLIFSALLFAPTHIRISYRT